MKKWIENLLDLQTLDMRIKKMKVRLRDIPREKHQAEKELNVEISKIETAKTNIKETELEIKKVESKISGFKDKIKGYQDKSALVKKNDEYRALMTEIETCKYHIEELETEQIGIMEKIEEQKKSLSNTEKAFNNIEVDVKETKEELDDLTASLDEEIKKSMEKRKGLIEKVDSTVLPIYSRLIRKDGEPLNPIKNGTCGNCHLKLTPQTLNDSKKGMVTTCDFCGYLVYYPEG